MPSSEYASGALDWGKGLGDTLVGAFQSAENAVGEFVKTGKLNVRDMVTSMLADIAKLSARRFILGPLANALSGALGGLGAPAGRAGRDPELRRRRPHRLRRTARRARRPRRLPRDDAPARARDRRDPRAVAMPAPVYVNINARDAQSFRQSRTQVAADLSRAVAAGRRGM